MGAGEVTRYVLNEVANKANRERHWHNLQGELLQRSLAASVNYPDVSGRTPLLALCGSVKVDVEIAAALLRAGADPMHRDVNGMTAFLECARMGHVQLGHMLLQALGGLLLVDADYSGKMALHWAVEQAQRTFVEFLLRCDAPTELPDGEGRSPCELAVQRGYEDIARLLRVDSQWTPEARGKEPQWAQEEEPDEVFSGEDFMMHDDLQPVDFDMAAHDFQSFYESQPSPPGQVGQ